MKPNKNYISIIIWSTLIIVCVICYGRYVQKCDKECVAYYLGGSTFEPILFQQQIYFPNDIPVLQNDWNHELGQEYGIVKSSRLYKVRNKFKLPGDYLLYLLVCQLWVDAADIEFTHVYITGGNMGAYSKVTFLEKSERIEELLGRYSSYIMLSKYKTNKKQYLLPKEIIIELEREFGECEYFETDFEEMKEAFYIYVNPYFQEGGTNADVRRMAEEGLHDTGHYISTIFMDEEGTLYYCNSNNVIAGGLAEEIKEVLEVGEMLKE